MTCVWFAEFAVAARNKAKQWGQFNTKDAHFKRINTALQGEAAKPQTGVVVKEKFMVVEYSTAFIFLNSYSAQPRECVGCHAQIEPYMPRLEIIGKKIEVGVGSKSTDRSSYAKFDLSAPCHLTLSCFREHPVVQRFCGYAGPSERTKGYPTHMPAHSIEHLAHIQGLSAEKRPSWACTWAQNLESLQAMMHFLCIL